MVEPKEKIEGIYIKISKKLYEELQYARDNLNDAEQQKIKKKKKTWSIFEVSHRIGKFLNKQRQK